MKFVMEVYTDLCSEFNVDPHLLHLITAVHNYRTEVHLSQPGWKMRREEKKKEIGRGRKELKIVDNEKE